MILRYRLRGLAAILINTCSVRDQAEQKALGKMGNMMHAGRDRKHVV